jgi:hypothetical protein
MGTIANSAKLISDWRSYFPLRNWNVSRGRAKRLVGARARLHRQQGSCGPRVKHGTSIDGRWRSRMTTKLAICSWVLNCLPPALHSWSRLVMIASAKTNCVLEPHRKAYFVCVCVCKFDSLAFPQYYLISAKRRKQLIGARPLCRAAHISRIKSFYDYQSTFREFQWERAMPITVQTNCQGNCQVCV